MPMYQYSDEIAEVVKKFLTDENWNYSFEENIGIFGFGLTIKSKIKKIRYLIDVCENELLTYGMLPIGADQEDSAQMAQMAEFICRANYGLKNGCFELDFRDGEIRFRSYVDCKDQLPSEAVVQNSVYCTAVTIQRYAPGIVDIIFGGATAKDAIIQCEMLKEEGLHSAEGGREDEDRPEDIRLNPFGSDGDVGSDQPPIRMELFEEEGGED